MYYRSPKFQVHYRVSLAEEAYRCTTSDPKKVLKTDPSHGPVCDPLPLLEQKFSQFRVATIPGMVLPPLAGGAIGCVGNDCVQYFLPKTARPMKDILGVPDSLFMLFDTIIAFDHFFQVAKVITYLETPQDEKQLEAAYQEGQNFIQKMIKALLDPYVPLPSQPQIKRGQEYTSNIGQAGYERHANRMKEHIIKRHLSGGPFQRLARPTSLHLFNLFHHLHTVNPSPYLFLY